MTSVLVLFMALRDIIIPTNNDKKAPAHIPGTKSIKLELREIKKRVSQLYL